MSIPSLFSVRRGPRSEKGEGRPEEVTCTELFLTAFGFGEGGSRVSWRGSGGGGTGGGRDGPRHHLSSNGSGSHLPLESFNPPDPPHLQGFLPSVNRMNATDSEAMLTDDERALPAYPQEKTKRRLAQPFSSSPPCAGLGFPPRRAPTPRLHASDRRPATTETLGTHLFFAFYVYFFVPPPPAVTGVHTHRPRVCTVTGVLTSVPIYGHRCLALERAAAPMTFSRASYTRRADPRFSSNSNCRSIGIWMKGTDTDTD